MCEWEELGRLSYTGYGFFKQTVGWSATLSLALALTGCAFGQVSQSAPPKGPYQVVQVTAQNWRWTMSSTHLQAGKTVKFVVRSLQDVHGFSIMGTNISTAVTQGDAPAIIYWTSPVKGSYTLACNVFCGAGHSSMTTVFAVT